MTNLKKEEKEVQVKKEPIKITITKLKELVESGKTREEIGKEFNLNTAQTSKLLKEANIKVKRKVTPAFILVDEQEETNEESNTLDEQVKESSFIKPSKTTIKKLEKESQEQEATSTENEW